MIRIEYLTLAGNNNPMDSALCKGCRLYMGVIVFHN